MNKKIEFTLLMISFSLMLVLVGSIMNIAVLKDNNCKMPVKYGEYNKQMDDKHFFVYSKEDIHYYYYSDIIVLFDYIVVSIGDILICLGSIGFIGFLIKYGVLKYKIEGG